MDKDADTDIDTYAPYIEMNIIHMYENIYTYKINIYVKYMHISAYTYPLNTYIYMQIHKYICVCIINTMKNDT